MVPTLPSILNSRPNPTAITRIKDYKTWLRLITSENLKGPEAFGKGLKNPSGGALSTLCLNLKKKKKEGNKRETKPPLALLSAHAQVSLLAESIPVGFVLLWGGGGGGGLQKRKDVRAGAGLCFLLQQNCKR